MRSKRFPGKVLAPFCGRPVIAHVISRVTKVLSQDQVVVATSKDPSDDPLAYYVKSLGIRVFRGSLPHVVARFQDCLKDYPCEWFFRICADSPLLDSQLLQQMSDVVSEERPKRDLITNIFPRTFPHGQSVELLNAQTFASIDASSLSEEDQEHVTKVYYSHPERFAIMNIESNNPGSAKLRLTVDVPEDIARLESYVKELENQYLPMLSGR